MARLNTPAMSVQLRPAVESDAAALATFAARMFTEAFGPANRPEDLARFLAANYSRERQHRELTDPAWTTIFAEDDRVVAGFAQLCPGSTPACVTGPSPLELARFYVAAAWHGRGVAQRLMAATIASARARGARTLWLGVWEQNPRAIAFYEKCGLADVGEKSFVVGTDVQHDRVMVRVLQVEP